MFCCFIEACICHPLFRHGHCNTDASALRLVSAMYAQRDRLQPQRVPNDTSRRENGMLSFSPNGSTRWKGTDWMHLRGMPLDSTQDTNLQAEKELYDFLIDDENHVLRMRLGNWCRIHCRWKIFLNGAHRENAMTALRNVSC